jgi:glycine cleavage system transcriptional repressor
MQEHQYLSIIAQSSLNTEILKEISHLIANHECNIVNSHITLQGEFYNFNFLISGNWSAIAKIETKLNTLTQKFPLQIFLKRTSLLSSQKPQLPYVLYFVTQDDPTVFYHIMRFLHQQSVDISEIYIDSYKTKNTQLPMTNTTIKIQLSADISISDWRERFILFCDDMNFDAIMEPEKP